MVRHQQHVAAQRRRVRATSRASCSASMSPVSSACWPLRIGDAQHAAQGVGLGVAALVVVVARVQQLEAHPIPLPRLAGAQRRCARPRQQRVPGLERRRQSGHRQRGQHRRRAADVVAVAVAQHQQVQALHAERAQQRHQHARAGVAVARVLRAGVVQQRVRTRAHEDRAALADVGDHELHRALGRPLDGRHEQRQHQRQRQCAHGPRQAQDQQRGTEQRRGLHPPGRGGSAPHRRGPGGQSLQQRRQALWRSASSGGRPRSARGTSRTRSAAAAGGAAPARPSRTPSRRSRRAARQPGTGRARCRPPTCSGSRRSWCR